MNIEDKWDRISERIGDLVWKEVHKLSEKQLSLLLGECAWMSRTNCSWVAYTLKDALMVLATPRLAQRKRRREQEEKEVWVEHKRC